MACGNRSSDGDPGAGPPSVEGMQCVLQLGDHGPIPVRGAVSAPRPPGCEPREPIVTELSFEIPAERLRASGTLVLPGLRGRAALTLNGVDLAVVDGGPGPTEVDVGEHLRAGVNELRALVDSPATLPVLVTNGCVHEPTLGDDVSLILHPESWIRSLALVAEGEGVGAAVRVHGAQPGNAVQVEAWLDGERLRWGGTAPIEAGGLATVASASWSGPRWTPGDPGDAGLVNVVATLLDGDGGVLDRASRRTGVRSVTFEGGQTRLDGEHHPLMAIRADPAVPPHEQLGSWVTAGVNALEIHGTVPSPSWLAEADELGVPVVVLPRCDHRLWAGIQPSERREAVQTQAGVLRDQDHALAWTAAPYPSVALWACEGDRDSADALCRTLTENDPRGTPAAGVQFPSRPIPGEGLRRDLLGGAGGDPGFGMEGWIVETIVETPSARGAVSARTFAQAVEDGAIGGVIPDREGAPQREWEGAWAGVAKQLGVPPLSPDRRRASARVRVQGLRPGQTAWIEVPGLTPVGGVADREGGVLLDAWHRGTATVRVDGEGREVDLSRVVWEDLRRSSDAQELTW